MNKKAVIISTGVVVLLIAFCILYEKIIYLFGLSVFLCPIIYIWNKKWLGECWFLFYIVDLCNVFALSFCGTFGELIWKLNYYTYGSIFILLIGFLVYIKIFKNKQYDIEILNNRIIPIKSNLSLEDVLNKLLIKYSIPGYIKSRLEGAFITRYYIFLDTEVSKLRFEGLSFEISKELNRKVMNCYTFEEVYIDVENENKNNNIFSEAFVIKQPSHLSLFDAIGNTIQLKYFRHMYIIGSENLINNILTNLLFTKIETDVIMYNCEFIQFSSVYEYIYTDIDKHILEMINEMNRRYTMILPYGRTMDEYDSVDQIQTLKKFKRKILVIFDELNVNEQHIEYIVQYGENVGIYVYNVVIGNMLADSDLWNLFKIKLLGPQNKDVTINHITLNTSKLCDENDVLFLNETTNFLIRLSVPQTTPQEQQKIMLFHNNLNRRYK